MVAAVATTSAGDRATTGAVDGGADLFIAQLFKLSCDAGNSAPLSTGIDHEAFTNQRVEGFLCVAHECWIVLNVPAQEAMISLTDAFAFADAAAQPPIRRMQGLSLIHI